MVKSIGGVAVLAMMIAAGAAVAQDVVKGLYLGSAELCAQAKKDGLQSVIEANNMILTNDGFEAIEFNCVFLQSVKHPGMPGGWVVTAMCEEPDHAYPEMFSVVERRAGELDIAALTEVNRNAEAPTEEPAEGGAAPGDQPDAGEEENVSSGLSGTYVLCEGVNPP